MTSWLEPLGRSRARRAGERRRWMAGGAEGPGTVVTSGGAPAPLAPAADERAVTYQRAGANGRAASDERAGASGRAASDERATADERAAREILAAFAYRRPARDAARRFRAIFALMNAAIVRLDTPLDPEVSVPAADRVLAGTPEHRVWNYFTDSTQTFFAGRWSGTRGKWRVRYTENELCVMTAGRVVISSELGERHTFGPGDAFVIPAGFSGTWEVLEDCAKIYAIFEPRV